MPTHSFSIMNLQVEPRTLVLAVQDTLPLSHAGSTLFIINVSHSVFTAMTLGRAFFLTKNKIISVDELYEKLI